MDYFLTFLEGFASFISPCILPMVPIYVSYFVGEDKDENKKNKALTNSIGFVIGFTIAFVLLSILASSLGSILNSIIKYVKIFFGILIIILGMNYMGIFNLKFLNRCMTFSTNLKNMNFFKALVFGFLFSLSWTPCVGAFLASALMMIAKQQDFIKGIILILLYSLGLGIPFIISAVIIDRLKSVFDFIKKHYKAIKIISGLILIGMGIYIIFF